MARTRPTLPSQASATAVAAVAKLPPLHPPYVTDFGTGSGAAPIPRMTPPDLSFPEVTAHYPLS